MEFPFYWNFYSEVKQLQYILDWATNEKLGKIDKEIKCDYCGSDQFINETSKYQITTAHLNYHMGFISRFKLKPFICTSCVIIMFLERKIYDYNLETLGNYCVCEDCGANTFSKRKLNQYLTIIPKIDRTAKYYKPSEITYFIYRGTMRNLQTCEILGYQRYPNAQWKNNDGSVFKDFFSAIHYYCKPCGDKITPKLIQSKVRSIDPKIHPVDTIYTFNQVMKQLKEKRKEDRKEDRKR